MPFFSIIVPIFNVEKYLIQCLDSLIHQTFDDIEIILVNDGSTDSSPIIAQEYANKDSRIKLITQENQGLSIARNNALKMGGGEYVLFVDSDDYIAITLCEKLHEILSKQPVDVLLIDYQKIKEDGFVYQTKGGHFLPLIPPHTLLNTKDFLKLLASSKHLLTTTIHFVCKNQVIKMMKPAFLPHIFYEDIYFATHLMEYCKNILFSNLALYYYRQNPQSIMANSTNPSKIDHSLSSYFTLMQHFYLKSKIQEDLLLKNLFLKTAKICCLHLFKILKKHGFTPNFSYQKLIPYQHFLNPYQRLLLFFINLKC